MEINIRKNRWFFLFISVFGSALFSLLLFAFLGFNLSFYFFHLLDTVKATFRPDLIVMSCYFLLYSSLIIYKDKRLFYNLNIASVISLGWMLLANRQYGYNQEMVSFYGFNAFPLFAWATGLFAIYLVFCQIIKRYKIKNFQRQFFFFVIFFVSLLLFAETFAYHTLNIRNVSTSMYSGLPICDCLHAPFWMQMSYFALGPIYFLVIFSKDRIISSKRFSKTN